MEINVINTIQAATDIQKYSETESRKKNVEEYNATASKYDAWCKTNTLMQNYCYYSTFAEIEKVKQLPINHYLAPVASQFSTAGRNKWQNISGSWMWTMPNWTTFGKPGDSKIEY